MFSTETFGGGGVWGGVWVEVVEGLALTHQSTREEGRSLAHGRLPQLWETRRRLGGGEWIARQATQGAAGVDHRNKRIQSHVARKSGP